MNARIIVIAVACVAFAAFGGFVAYRAGLAEGLQHSAPSRANASTPPASASNRGGASSGASLKSGDIDPSNGRKILYWHDPMAPGQKFDKPGKSPYMDMQLVPVYADGSNQDEGAVSISSRVQQNLGVRTAEVKRGALAIRVGAVGSVAYNERDVAVVQARSNGYLERLYVRAPLDSVRRGQPLADVYVPDWVAAQEEYLVALHIARADSKAYAGLADAARQRMRLAGMTEAQIGRVEASGAVQARMTLVAPMGGVVTELAAREGMTVTMGAPLFRINGLGTVWVNAEVPETLAAQVRPGNAVEATASALPGGVFKGKVSAILPEVNVTTRTIKARIELANPGGRLVPGMFANVNFAPVQANDALLVPTEAVIQTGKRTVVIVGEGDGRFTPVDVEIGSESNGKTEVRKGLAEGQKVVVSGQFLIDSEASLRGTTNRMAASADATDATAAAAGKVTHRTTGVVESIDAGEVTLSHQAVPTLGWGPMTMSFTLADRQLASRIAVGQKVAFEFRATAKGAYEIVSISPDSTNASTSAVPGHGHGPGARS
jgi:membrane fusion protein, copper/silver efflux system